MKKVDGFSLIELMLSAILSLLFLTVVIQVYLQYQKTSIYANDIARRQENARLALSLLNQSIREAGFWGCRRFDANLSFKNNTSLNVSPENLLQIYHGRNNAWSPGLPFFLIGKVKPGTDAIQLFRAVNPLLNLIEKTTDRKKIMVSNKHLFKKSQYLLISDCEKAELFTVKNIKNLKGKEQIILLDKPLKYFYGKTATVSLVKKEIFFIKKSNRKNRFGEAIYSLYEYDQNGRAEELVPGIDRLIVSRQGNLLRLRLSATTLHEHLSHREWTSDIYLREFSL